MAQRRDESPLDDAPLGVGAPLGDRDALRAPNADDGSADLSAELAELGLTPRGAWCSSAVLYGGGGLLVTSLYAIDPAIFPRGVFYLGCFAIVAAALCLFAALCLADSVLIMKSMTHARHVTALAIYVIGFVMLKDKTVAFALIPLLTIPPSCYLYTWRFALLYGLVAALIVGLALLPVSGPARVAHALITTFAIIVIAASMVVAKQRTRRLASRNRQLAYTDPLTGIANMRSLRERISAGLGRPSGDERPFALFAIDLDNFKQVNDRFDYSLGDRVLCAVSAALSEELEPGDLAVRRGGDEFSVLVPNLAARDLEELRDRLQRAIVRARIAACPQITPSGTVAYIRTRPGEELGVMMERADRALHDAKVNSRDRRRGEKPQLAEPVDTIHAEDARPTAGAQTRPEHPAESAHTEQARAARRITRAVTEAIGHSNPDWRFAASLLGLTGIAIAVVSIGQMVEPLTPAAGGAITAGLAALTVTCAWATTTRSGVSPKRLHVPWIAAYGLIALAIVLAGRSGTALLDLLPMIVLYGFLLFKARTAAFYLIVGQALYGAFAIGGGFANGVVRTVITTVVVAVVAGLIAKLRLVTVRFSRRNRELSELDALTGVANLRALRGRIVDVIERASSQQLHPVVVAIDLD